MPRVPPPRTAMNCDRLAPWYRWLEYAGFGRALERRREAFITRASVARNALLLGDGDGRFAAALRRVALPGLRVTSVDNSVGMLRLAERRLRLADDAGENVPVEFVHADAPAWLGVRHAAQAAGNAEPFDLIATHFFLDCFPAAEQEAVIGAIAAVAAPGACWVVSEFRQPAGSRWEAWHAAAWLWGLHLFFRWTTGLTARSLADHRPALAAQGFRRIACETSRAGLLVSEWWQRSA